MNVKKFTGATSREALRKVRDALGADAVILSNRSVDGAIEILALAPEDMAALAEPVVETRAAAPVSAPAISQSTLAALTTRRKAESAVETPAPSLQPSISQSTLAALAPRHMSENNQASRLAETLHAAREANAAAGQSATAEMSRMMAEIRAMRGMLESQLAELSFSSQQQREPAKSAVLREMLSAGYSASLGRFLTEKMPSGLTAEAGMAWMRSILSRNLTTLDNENDILDRGGVYALVGPTGVGKTTTTAKLAARCVMRHGAGKLALITTDGYRIGGYEQLRIYGKILGVMVHSVKDETDLKIALAELKNKHMVLIDTVGMSQRDQMVGEQIAMLSGTDTKVNRLLCMSATSSGETLNEVVRAYQGSGLAGCIMTKLDEAATIGGVLDVAIRQKLKMYYVANGQRVPEDLHVANKDYLVDRSFKLKRETAPFQVRDAELPLVVANAVRGMNDSSLREVSLGQLPYRSGRRPAPHAGRAAPAYLHLPLGVARRRKKCDAGEPGRLAGAFRQRRAARGCARCDRQHRRPPRCAAPRQPAGRGAPGRQDERTGASHAAGVRRGEAGTCDHAVPHAPAGGCSG
ncbi:flagellar biosynthesis protein FlhF [Paucimonas lemoignei]|uniref:Flagellar biosynthesis protein FlhF n=1 Tax=Paucimonas lemoignei TaxID=29443 RepID=A0A4V2UJ87_PAULE|nr:flagellar biosynthesis protein FlhF [Paucimonas lemoignei]